MENFLIYFLRLFEKDQTQTPNHNHIKLVDNAEDYDILINVIFVKAVFKWLSKAITRLPLVRSVIGFKFHVSFSTNEKQNQNESHL